MAMEAKHTILIRNANREDCVAIMGLKKELAVHQNMGDLPMLSAKELEHDGFDANPPCFRCIVAELLPHDPENGVGNKTQELNASKTTDSMVVGYALYFFGYAAFEGKILHLEDLCVTKWFRGGGAGSKLVKKLAKIALDEKCARIQLEVLDWNPARKFYDSLGGWNTTMANGRHNFRLDADAIKKLATS